MKQLRERMPVFETWSRIVTCILLCLSGACAEPEEQSRVEARDEEGLVEIPAADPEPDLIEVSPEEGAGAEGSEAAAEAAAEMLVSEPVRVEVGEPMELPYARHTVLSAETVEFPSYNERVVLIHLRVENEHPEAPMVYNPFFYALVDRHGQVYVPVALFAMRDEMLQPGRLQPGESVEGYIGYDIPAEVEGARLLLMYGELEQGSVALNLNPEAEAAETGTSPAADEPPPAADPAAESVSEE